MIHTFKLTVESCGSKKSDFLIKQILNNKEANHLIEKHKRIMVIKDNDHEKLLEKLNKFNVKYTPYRKRKMEKLGVIITAEVT